MMQKTLLFFLLFSFLLCGLVHNGHAQTITGVWRGKINRQNAELKLVKSGDDIVGTVYYYSGKKYRRYSLRGHFDPESNAVIWWDEVRMDELEKGTPLFTKADPAAQLMVADFNCPGGDEMLLDGSSTPRDQTGRTGGPLHLQKMAQPLFPDEWDAIIENYFVGANDPHLIDSISRMGFLAMVPEEKAVGAAPVKEAPPVVVAAPPAKAPVTAPVAAPVTAPPVAAAPREAAPATVPNANLNKFSTRKNVLQTVIPLTAEVVELRFYDNAEVDGDSIALFLNGKLLLEHIRLTEEPYVVKLRASELGADNELVMVAENLGSIPPNTSFMVAIVGNKRYEARLYANENSSALVRIIREPEKK